MTGEESTVVDHSNAYCDGDLGSLGHPRVYLPMSPEGVADCPYCGRHFVLKGSPAEDAGSPRPGT